MTLVGRGIVSALVKLIPGGSAANVLISGSTATGLTVALGEMYIAVLKKLVEKNDRLPTESEITAEFAAAWTASKADRPAPAADPRTVS